MQKIVQVYCSLMRYILEYAAPVFAEILGST